MVASESVGRTSVAPGGTCALTGEPDVITTPRTTAIKILKKCISGAPIRIVMFFLFLVMVFSPFVFVFMF
jgi:hypothetical protein